MLSVEVTQELLTKAKLGCNDSKTRLLTSNAPLIKSIIKHYIGKGVDYDDLYQLGALGFVKAMGKYDATFGVKFTTYAVPLIAGEVKRFLRDDGSIKVSRSVKTLYTRIKRHLITCHGAEMQPTPAEIAAALDVTAEEVIYALEAAQMPISIYEKSDGQGDGDGLSLSERLADNSLESQQGNALVDKIMIRNMLQSLDSRERKVIILRYFRNMTQTQVAEKLTISQVQVSRIEQRALAQFRSHLSEDVG